MRLFGVILLIFILQNSSPAFAQDDVKTIYVSAAVSNKALEIKKMLEEILPAKTPVVYTIVPRGLVVSVREDVFFRGENTKINLSGIYVLDGIVTILRKVDNNCTVESHTDGHNNPCGIYGSNWEISLARANSITEYLVYCGKIESERVFALGFGECMPFKDNVSAAKAGFDKRIDFVIFDYEYSRD